MIERLLFDRIDAEARRASVGREHHRVAFALAHEARAALALVQAAVARTQVALDAAVVEPMPPAAGMIAHNDAPLGSPAGTACDPARRRSLRLSSLSTNTNDA